MDSRLCRQRPGLYDQVLQASPRIEQSPLDLPKLPGSLRIDGGEAAHFIPGLREAVLLTSELTACV